MKAQLLLVLVFLNIFISHAVAAIDVSSVVRANDFYNQGDYKSAIDLYYSNKIPEIGGSELLFNLGNFHYKNGELGKAIFYYKRAAELAPRDGDIKFNLDFLRKKASDKIEAPSKSVWQMLSFNNIFSAEEALLLLASSSLFFWIMLIVYYLKKYEVLKWLTPLVFIIFMIVGMVVVKDHLQRTVHGVVIAAEADVYAGIGANNVLLFTLHEGAEFEIKEIYQDSWIQILLVDGKRGWLEKRHVIY